MKKIEKHNETIIMHKMRKSREDWFVDILSYSMLIILTLTILFPFMQVITISMSPSSVVNKSGFHLIPTKFDFSGYEQIISNKDFLHSYLITILRTMVGTSLSILVTVLTAYPLSKTKLPYRRSIMLFIVFTMYFQGGMIPKYLLLKNLHLHNNFMVYVLPSLVIGFTLVITRNFFMGVPDALEESARIDGATDLRILFSIYLPLSVPIIATIGLWYSVHHWNAWTDNMLYVSNKSLFVLQYVLHQILESGTASEAEEFMHVVVHTETMKMAALVLSLIPIVSVYPFLQKYFVKGMVLGSVKG